MNNACRIIQDASTRGLVDAQEAQAVRECVSDKHVGEFGSGGHEYTFEDGSKLIFSGGENRKARVEPLN